MTAVAIIVLLALIGFSLYALNYLRWIAINTGRIADALEEEP